MNYIPTFDEIKKGLTTDIYFRRTVEILKAKGLLDVPVKAEIFLKKLPADYRWGVFAGVSELLSLLEGKGVRVFGLPEGSLFFPGEPVLVIEGPYGRFAEMETAILGVICQASGIVTKAARVKEAAGEKQVLSFGARRMHPALSVFIDRYAYIGGCDGVSVVLSAEKLGIKPTGTVPHALILVIGDTVEAMRAFDEVVSRDVKRICLIDTFQDEKFEAVRVASEFGERLFAVRLDTPASRRGDFREILKEVRWELDVRGFENVKIFVSGGLSEKDVMELRDLVDGFGVGTSISNAPVFDFSMDIVEVNGKLLAKRGKLSGAKKVAICPRCVERHVILMEESGVCRCGARLEELFVEMMKDGKRLSEEEPVDVLRGRVREEIKRYGGEL